MIASSRPYHTEHEALQAGVDRVSSGFFTFLLIDGPRHRTCQYPAEPHMVWADEDEDGWRWHIFVRWDDVKYLPA